MSMQESALARRVEQLLAENAELRVKGESLRADAERYRFLRENEEFSINYTGFMTLDEFIDVAMAGQGAA